MVALSTCNGFYQWCLSMFDTLLILTLLILTKGAEGGCVYSHSPSSYNVSLFGFFRTKRLEIVACSLYLPPPSQFPAIGLPSPPTRWKWLRPRSPATALLLNPMDFAVPTSLDHSFDRTDCSLLETSFLPLISVLSTLLSDLPNFTAPSAVPLPKATVL